MLGHASAMRLATYADLLFPDDLDAVPLLLIPLRPDSFCARD